MYCRCAYFIGEVDTAHADTFRHHLETVVAPMVAQLPGIRGLRLHWSRERGRGAPGIYLAVEHHYDDARALEQALASEARSRMWKRLEEVLPYFRGHLVFVNYDMLEVPVAS